MTRRKLTSATIRGEIIKAMRLGILLTTKVGEKVNSMTIGWGTLGGICEKRVFVAYVCRERFTREMLDDCREFTISVPVGEYRRKILGMCGVPRALPSGTGI